MSVQLSKHALRSSAGKQGNLVTDSMKLLLPRYGFSAISLTKACLFVL